MSDPIQQTRDGLAALGFRNYDGVWLCDVSASDGEPQVRWEEGDDIVTLEIDGGYIVMFMEHIESALALMQQAQQLVTPQDGGGG